MVDPFQDSAQCQDLGSLLTGAGKIGRPPGPPPLVRRVDADPERPGQLHRHNPLVKQLHGLQPQLLAAWPIPDRTARRQRDTSYVPAWTRRRPGSRRRAGCDQADERPWPFNFCSSSAADTSCHPTFAGRPLQQHSCLNGQSATRGDVFILGMWSWGPSHPHSARTGGAVVCGAQSASAL